MRLGVGFSSGAGFAGVDFVGVRVGVGVGVGLRVCFAGVDFAGVDFMIWEVGILKGVFGLLEWPS